MKPRNSNPREKKKEKKEKIESALNKGMMMT